jgi:NAD(P)-dependent dehydrogenase (short-subunit alcohol dehydrogenase family)
VAKWTASDIPDQTGRVAVVTGANSGLGYVTALELARHGARVVLACRDRERGEAAKSRLRFTVPTARVQLKLLDLADLASIHAFAADVASSYDGIDLLINNAGVMAIPRRETADGFEMQLGTNHLGHFALTAQLWPRIAASPAARVVTVSSSMAFVGKLDLDDLQSGRHYGPLRTYAMSKLANLHFMLELGRRAPGVVSVAAHPGASATNLQRESGFSAWFVRALGQSAEQGAWPTLYAAVADAVDGAFIGPRDRLGMVGPPVRGKLPKRAHDQAAAAVLWTRSEELTGVRFAIERAAVSRAS